MWRVFNKTFGFAYSFCGFQKQRKQAKTAPFLSAKQRTPFPEHRGGISGKIKTRTPIFVLCGSHSHEVALLFPMTIFSTIIVQKKRKPPDDPQRKNAEARLGVPFVGIVVRQNELPLFLLDFEVFEDFLHCFLGGSHQHCFDECHCFFF